MDEFYAAEPAEDLSQTRALGEIKHFMAKTDVAVGAAGSLPGNMQRLWRAGEPGTYHMEYGFSNMGHETNGALGVKLAQPDREVYTFFGDGTYLMAHPELLTCVQGRLRVHFCLFVNSGWGCIENLQNNPGNDAFEPLFRSRNPRSGELDDPVMPIDFAKNAAYGLKTYIVRTVDELRAALKEDRKQPLPILYHIKVLPGSMQSPSRIDVPGFKSWRHVGVAEISEQPCVQKAYEDIQRHTGETRKF